MAWQHTWNPIHYNHRQNHRETSTTSRYQTWTTANHCELQSLTMKISLLSQWETHSVKPLLTSQWETFSLWNSLSPWDSQWNSHWPHSEKLSPWNSLWNSCTVKLSISPPSLWETHSVKLIYRNSYSENSQLTILRKPHCEFLYINRFTYSYELI